MLMAWSTICLGGLEYKAENVMQIAKFAMQNKHVPLPIDMTIKSVSSVWQIEFLLTRSSLKPVGIKT